MRPSLRGCAMAACWRPANAISPGCCSGSLPSVCNIIAARRIGFVFQSYNLIPVLNALENVELPLVLQGVSAAVRLRQSLALLQAVDLAEKTAAVRRN
ncbi:MAG: hypothetical protein AB1767_12535 [Bacillota bacterium]